MKGSAGPRWTGTDNGYSAAYGLAQIRLLLASCEFGFLYFYLERVKRYCRLFMLEKFYKLVSGSCKQRGYIIPGREYVPEPG